MNPICPWCQTEIVWDPEFGPEDLCPHCSNELNEYRTVNLQRNDDDQVDLARYEEAVDSFLDEQVHSLDCSHCQESMVFAGIQQFEPAAFTAAAAPKGRQPFLVAPFATKLYVCPACFHVSQVLSDQDRVRTILNLSGE